MNTVTNYANPENPEWNYVVRIADDERPDLFAISIPFATAQDAADWIALQHPGETFHWQINQTTNL